MTWGNRFRLLTGLVAVVAAATLATVHLSESRGRVESTSAQISAESYTVGNAYAGMVVDQLVEVGDTVADGDPMFLIDSANLQRDISQNAVPARTVESSIDENGFLVVRATGPGTVTGLGGSAGGFVAESTQVATVQRSGTFFVEAEYELTPQQYARLGEDAEATIVLPDQREIQGTVTGVAVTDSNGHVWIVATVRSDELTDGTADRLVADGTPVTVRLQLENDGFVNDVAQAVQGYLSVANDSVGQYLAEVMP
ncbi:HlyD family efflux transporter periplasmic adaptor subunit [Actinotalea sp. K2]|uniref:HlyD family efflux transporter periplasmic adaptor subunit n=1 Tax=Actinotalea sp. K2 TaxID=2939438 RepID=UPI002017F410|nr:HlyD family efflux transporter periplasmic adaptor subunit [Actinotalea sp. K2]MCL3859692.1 biotin attachment protein [Actinotalea sp. K2]